MDNLFTPEVIEKFLELLTTAADGGVKAVILWLVLPTVAILITASAWLFGIVYAIRRIAGAYENHVDARLAAERCKVEKPKVLSYKGILVNGDAEDALEQLLKRVRKHSSYVHASDIDALDKAWTNDLVKYLGGRDYSKALIKALKKTYGTTATMSYTDFMDLENLINERKQTTEQDTEVA